MSDVYTGPAFPDRALVTADELSSGRLQAPDGTVPYQVQSGDNLTRIAQTYGYESLEALYAHNPQYAERNPDLIYPGEVVFVPDGGLPPEAQATNAAAHGVGEAQQAADTHAAKVAAGEPHYSGSDQKFYSMAVSQAQGTFDTVALEEINAVSSTGNSREDHALSVIASSEQIAQRLEFQGYPDQAARVRTLGQERATEIRNEH